MTDLWTEASRDAEAEQMSRMVTSARVAASEHWPFLAEARDQADYTNRKALIADRLDGVVSSLLPNNPVAFSVVRASLEAAYDQDFQVIAAEREQQEAERRRMASQVEARRSEDAMRARVEANLRRKAAEESAKTAAKTATEDRAGLRVQDASGKVWVSSGWGDATLNPATGEWTKIPDSIKVYSEDNVFENKTITKGDIESGKFKVVSSKTAAETVAPATGTAPETQKTTENATATRQVDQDPATGEFVGSEWQASPEDPNTLVQTDATFGKNPRFATQEEADAWVAETGGATSGKTEDTTKADTSSNVPAQFKSSKTATEHSPKVNYPGSDTETECSCGWKGEDGKTLREHLEANGKEAAKTATGGHHDTCSTCGGTGQVASPEGASDHAEGYAKCASCDGTGQVWVDDPTATASRKTASWVGTAREVLSGHQHAEVDGMILDATTASMLVQVYDALSGANQATFEAMPLAQAVDFGWKLLSRVSSRTADRKVATSDYDAGYANGKRDKDNGDDPGVMQVSDEASDYVKGYWDGYGGKEKQATRSRHPFAREAETHPPYEVKERDGKWVVVNSNGDVKGTHDSEDQAREQQKALYANVKDAVKVAVESNPYSTPGNPYVPPQSPPGTPDDVLDGPVNPNPTVIEQPMTTRPRQMPSGDSSLPPVEPMEPTPPTTTRPTARRIR